MKLETRVQAFAHMIRNAKEEGFYPYFRTISRSLGPEVEVGTKRLIMVGSNDYLGLTHDPRVIESASHALRQWGTGPGGSRFLNGTLAVHEMLEERLAALVGKKKAVAHTTGFGTNLGSIGCLLTSRDAILCDRENHASIFEGCRASPARVFIYEHNDADSAAEKMASAREKRPDACIFLITDGVFSMSGDVAPLSELAKLKKKDPDVAIYLDDAHGLGVMGPKGRGTASHFGLTREVDFLMGTFSKALAATGGFIASDHEDMLTYLRHHSRTLIFSAALPAVNVATVLACLDILDKEPERVERLRNIVQRVRAEYRRIGLYVRDSQTPIMPIYIGSEIKAHRFARDLFRRGVFAFPAVFPAVPKGQAVIRTAYMSTHEDKHIVRVLDVLDQLARKYRIRVSDLNGDEPVLPG